MPLPLRLFRASMELFLPRFSFHSSLPKNLQRTACSCWTWQGFLVFSGKGTRTWSSSLCQYPIVFSPVHRRSPMITQLVLRYSHQCCNRLGAAFCRHPFSFCTYILVNSWVLSRTTWTSVSISHTHQLKSTLAHRRDRDCLEEECCSLAISRTKDPLAN